MIGDILQPTHLLFVLVVALLVLGPKRLPEAGRALGRGIRDFRTAISGDDDRSDTLPTQAAPAPPPEAVVPPATAPPVETAPAPSDTAAPPTATQPADPTATQPAEHPETHPAEHTEAQSAEAETVHPVG
jgi:sec-independent protein translocase protein TatA